MSRRKRRTRSWAADQRRDAYVREARRVGYRSRAAYKLQQLDQRERLFSRRSRVLDLGAAPGGWSQYARSRAADGAVVALDLLPMEPVDGVVVVQGDFGDSAVQARLVELAAPGAYDLVISDMSPNITGNADVDQANAADLAARVIDFAARMLAKNGVLVVKVFEGDELPGVRRRGQAAFRRCTTRKPDASRSRSRECYLVMRQPQQQL